MNAPRTMIYGHTGVVGRQLYDWLDLAGVPVGGVSLDREAPIEGAEWVFVCVPTPTREDGTQDTTALDAVIGGLKGNGLGVVIRSTVLPGTCDDIQDAHPEWDVYHWPEFLSARSAWMDFRNPAVQVVGGRNHSRWLAEWQGSLPAPSQGWKYVRLTEAEVIKYAHNAHGAMQVIFGNLVFDMRMRAKEVVRPHTVHIALRDMGYISEKTMAAYWHAWLDGKRGYGGACFPKDVAALRRWMGDDGLLLEGMEAANKRLGLA